MTRIFLLYDDAGADGFSVRAATHYFRKFGEVRPVSAEQVIDGACFDGADAVIMPGGADMPYCDKLNGAGNHRLRQFVEQGGLYIGICAGAYYGCRDIAFHQGRPDEICARRELAFYEGTAIGSIAAFGPYYDETIQSAATVSVTGPDQKTYRAYYFGGCYFTDGDEAAHVLARYSDLPDTPPAIIVKNIGRGRVILSGVHFEATPDLIRQRYANEPADDKERAEKLAGELEQGPAIEMILEDLWT